LCVVSRVNVGLRFVPHLIRPTLWESEINLTNGAMDGDRW
jgi:hypothetical protein